MNQMEKMEAAVAKVQQGLAELNSAYNESNDTQVRLFGWHQLTGLMAWVKTAENVWRKDMFAAFFPGHKKGTKHVDLGNGFKLSAVGKINYSVDKDLDRVESVLDAIEKVSTEAKFLADRLLKTKYELAEGEYNKLDPNNPEHMKIKALVDSVITTSDGTPSLEVVPPKAAA